MPDRDLIKVWIFWMGLPFFCAFAGGAVYLQDAKWFFAGLGLLLGCITFMFLSVDRNHS